MEKKSVKKNERKLEKELLGVLIFLGILIAIFLIASAYFKSLNYFDYEGLTFSKEMLGDIPLFHHTYYVKTQAGIAQYNFYLRNDPRYNNVTLTGKPSRLMNPGSVVYISVNSDGLQECRYGALAVGTLSSFVSDNQMKVIAGNLDFWQAGTKKSTWATCENKPGSKVIEIYKGNETKVEINGTCYKVEVANCQILEAIEKLEVQSILDAKKIAI